MADRERVRRTINKIQVVKTWQLVILLILVGFIAATFLRLNNIGMVQRREALTAADEAGVEKDITLRLLDLQRYVSSHMNTDLGDGAVLQASYNRAVEKAKSEAFANDTNDRVYGLADEYCKPQFSAWSMAYLECFVSQLEKYPAANELKSQLNLPDAKLYVHDFVSPVWSPDWAGFSVLAFLIILAIIVARLIGLLVLRIILRLHYRNI